MGSSNISYKKCAYCGYQSGRMFNIFRHEDRIHRELKDHRNLRCCKKLFRTKGEYYAHVELSHPHTRVGRISRNKYKIVKPWLNNFNLKATSAFKIEHLRQKSPAATQENLCKKRISSHSSKNLLKRRITTNISMMTQKSLRLKNMPPSATYNRFKIEFLQKISVDWKNTNFEEVPLKIFLDFPELITFWKSDTKDLIPKLMSAESTKPVVAKVEKTEAGEITNDIFPKKLKKEEFSSLPLKKRILKNIQGHEPPRNKLRLSQKNYLEDSENCPAEVKIVLDPMISWPKNQQISDYLQEITFEIYKIS